LTLTVETQLLFAETEKEKTYHTADVQHSIPQHGKRPQTHHARYHQQVSARMLQKERGGKIRPLFAIRPRISGHRQPRPVWNYSFENFRKSKIFENRKIYHVRKVTLRKKFPKSSKKLGI